MYKLVRVDNGVRSSFNFGPYLHAESLASEYFIDGRCTVGNEEAIEAGFGLCVFETLQQVFDFKSAIGGIINAVEIYEVAAFGKKWKPKSHTKLSSVYLKRLQDIAAGVYGDRWFEPWPTGTLMVDWLILGEKVWDNK